MWTEVAKLTKLRGGSTSQMTLEFNLTDFDWRFDKITLFLYALGVRCWQWDSRTGLSLQMNPLTCNCLQRFKCFFKVNGDSSCRLIHCWWCTVCWTYRFLMHQCTTCGKNAAFKTFQFLSSFIHFKSGQMKSTGWNSSSIKEGGNYCGGVAQLLMLTHQNYRHEMINSKLHSGSVCHHWGHNILCSSLLSKSMKIKIHNYKFAYSFIWVWNLVCHIKGSTWAEGVGQ